MEERAYIGLGTNLGDREQQLRSAAAELALLPGTRLVLLSPFYETEPVGGVPQGNFYNAAAAIATTLPPRELLNGLKRIESCVFHRLPSGRWGARSMDLDILLYADLVVTEESLTIPHPRLAQRCFALQPLADIAPSLLHPTLGRSIAQLLAEVDNTQSVVRISKGEK